MSLRQAATYCGVSHETLRRWVKAGRLPATRERSPGRQGWRYVVKREAVEALELEQDLPPGHDAVRYEIAYMEGNA